MYVYVVYRCVHMCLCGHTCGKGCSCTLVGLRIEIWSLPQSLSTLFTEAGPLSWTPRSLICSLACSGSPPSAFGALGLQVGVTWSRLLHSSWGWTAGITWPGLLHSSWGQKAGPPLGAYTNRGAISSPVHPFVLNMYGCSVHICLCVCNAHRSQERALDPWSWCYRCLWATMWMLGIELYSCGIGSQCS